VDQADQGSVIRGKRWLGFRVCWESNNNSMRPDIYTKAVLTVIAVMLTVIAVKPLISPDTTASAQSGQFVGVQYGNLDFFDSRTGEVFSFIQPQRDREALTVAVQMAGGKAWPTAYQRIRGKVDCPPPDGHFWKVEMPVATWLVIDSRRGAV